MGCTISTAEGHGNRRRSSVQSALGKLEARNRVEAVFKLSELRLL